MTIDEYERVAKMLAAICDELARIGVMVSNAHGRMSASKFSTSIGRARYTLTGARLRLEGLACKDYGTNAGMMACSALDRPSVSYCEKGNNE